MSSKKPIHYKMTLEVTEEDVTRTFASSRNAKNQDDLATHLAYEIVRMVGIMNAPPTIDVVASAFGEGIFSCPLTFLANLQRRYWTAEHGFKDCLLIGVNVGMLCDGDGGDDDKRKEAVVRSMIAGVGYAEEISDAKTEEKS